MKQQDKNQKDYWFSRTGSSHTMKTWPRQINSQQDIPDEFKEVFSFPGEIFPYCVYIPPDRVLKEFRLTETESKLLVLFKNKLEIYSSRKNSPPGKILLNFSSISSLEVGEILLYSWITLYSGQKKIRVVYSAARETLFAPFIKAIRDSQRKDSAPGIDEKRKDEDSFDFLQSLNYKYMNLAKASVSKKDRVRQVYFQEDSTVKSVALGSMTLFRKFICPHIIIKTDSELILLNEDKLLKTNFDTQYGGVSTYIPLQAIESVSFDSTQYRKTGKISLSLRDGLTIDRFYSLDNGEFEQLKRLHLSGKKQ